MTGVMSRPIKNLEHVWRALALVFFAIICGEAWYIHQLSNQVIEGYEESSKALDRHLADQYQIATLKRAARDREPDPESAPQKK